MSCTDSPRFSPAWFDECFQPSETPVPADLRQLSETLCRTYNIKGICDPMYIANVAAVQFGRGDGRSMFYAGTGPAQLPTDDALAAFVARFRFAYGSSVGDDEAEVSKLVRASLTAVPA